MKTVNALPRQTLWDIAVEHCGSADAAPDIARLNGISPTAPLRPGQRLIVPQPLNTANTRLYANRPTHPATCIADSAEAWTFGWTEPRCAQSALWHAFSWTDPLCRKAEPHTFLWTDPICQQTEGPYTFLWTDPICQQASDSWTFGWTEPRCAQRQPHTYHWTDALCTQRPVTAFSWTDALCTMQYTPDSGQCSCEPLEWDNIENT